MGGTIILTRDERWSDFRGFVGDNQAECVK